MASIGSEEGPAIPFLDKKEDEKVRQVCEDLFFVATSLPTVEGKSDASFLPKMPDPFPLPSFNSYMADSTGGQRRATFFRVARGSDCAFYAEVVGKKDNFHTLKILSSDFPIKIDDLRISAMIPAQELVHPEADILVKAVAVGTYNKERILILSTKPEQFSSNFKHKGMKMGVIDYKDLPAHYKLEQERPRIPLHEYIEKYAHLNTEDCDKILEYLNIDPKRMYFAHSDKVKPEEMGDTIIQQQKEKLSRDHLQIGLKMCRKMEAMPSAEVEFRRAISFNCKNANAFASLGSLYRNQKRYKEAIESFESALDLDEENENYKQLLIKTIKDYLNNDKTNEYDEKLIQSIRLCNLQGNDDKKNNVLKYYLEAKLSLFIGPPWFENFNIEEWNEKQEMKNLSDMELASDNECKDLIMEENLILDKSEKSVENILTIDQKPNVIKVGKDFAALEIQDKSAEKTQGLVDISYGCDEGNKSGSDAPSVEEISDSSLKQSDCPGGHRKQEKKSNHCKDPERPYDGAGYTQEITVISSRNRRRRDIHKSPRKIIPQRYDEERAVVVKDRSPSEHHYSEERSSSRSSRRRRYSREKGTSSKSHRRRYTEDRSSTSKSHSRHYSRNYSRERSCHYSGERSPSPHSSRYSRETSFSPGGRRYSRERSSSSHGHHYSKERSPSSSTGHNRSREKSPVLSTHNLSREKSPGLSTCSLSKEKSPGLNIDNVSIEKSPGSSTQIHLREKKSGSRTHIHRHSRKKRRSGHISTHLRHQDRLSPESGSRDSSDYRTEKGLPHFDLRDEGERTTSPAAKHSLSPSRRIVEDYYDLDIPERYLDQEDRWKPQALFSCTSYPSFTKKPAVSIMNEIVDMIEDVRNESK